MRKSRTVVKEVDIKVSENFGLNPHLVFEALEKMDIVIPSWGNMMFVFVRAEKGMLDVSVFEDAKDFFLWYTKIMVRQLDDLKSASYSREIGKEWKLFMPPTLIGVNLRTKLRF